MAITSVNPANQQVIQSFEETSAQDVQKTLDALGENFQIWQKSSFPERSALLNKMAQILNDHREDYAQTITLEMGKPIAQSRTEIDKCASVCEFYAQNAQKFLLNQGIQTEAQSSYVAFRPLGTIFAVMPWNFPFWQVFRFLAPALMAGNTAVLKHASNVMGSALKIEEVVTQASPDLQLFSSLLIRHTLIKDVIDHPAVAAVTLTGSTPAGQSVASLSGQALKKCVLELGGSDAYVVLEDADLDLAVKTCLDSRMINSGQSCVAAKRFVVVQSQIEAFKNKLIDYAEKFVIGDPQDENTNLGPLAREDLRDELHRQVEQTLAQGADCWLGGQIPDRPGAYYPLTLLGNVRKGMVAYEQELFGPVASIIEAKDQQDAIDIANDSVFGLGAAVFTKDEHKGQEIAEKHLQAGCCFVNTMVRSDARLPFGGIKQSGYGRELSAFGIREFVNAKTVYVA